MGTFMGHFIPGAEFMALAFLLNLIHKAEQLDAQERGEDVECKYESVGSDGKETASAPPPDSSRTRKIKLIFSLYTIISIGLGILYEGLGGIVMNKPGGFLAEKGHLSMYLGFLPAGIAYGFESGLLPGSKQRHVVNAPLLSNGAFTVGFFNQYVQLSAHAMMKEMGADTTFHQVWATAAGMVACAFAVSTLAQLANMPRLARVAQLSCPAALNIQGSWIIFTGWTLFGGEFRVMRNNDMDMEEIFADFAFCVIIWTVVQYAWIEAVSPSVAKAYRCCIR